MAGALRLSRRDALKISTNAVCMRAYPYSSCDYHLTSHRRQFLPAASHLHQQRWNSSDKVADDRNIRMSPLNIQMISKSLHEQIFGEERPISDDKIRLCQQHLESYGLGSKPGSVLPNVNIALPSLFGATIDDHFRVIAENQSRHYLELAIKLAESTIPPMPRRWRFEPGWTKYVGKEAYKVDCPEDDALVFDVEVCVSESPQPVLATAVSEKCWYSWVSKRLASSEDFRRIPGSKWITSNKYFSPNVQQRLELENLIPLETKEGDLDPISGSWSQRLVVGHNVSYDRARVKEQYLIKGPRTKFLDTMSLHTCVAGQSTEQKILWWQKEGWKRVEVNGGRGRGRSRKANDSWMCVSSPGSLVDVHWLYVGAKEGRPRLSKEKRNVFVKGKIQDIRRVFQSLMQYCAADVMYTHEILQKVLPLFLHHCPHPVTFAGMLEMGTPYLPVNSSWEQYTDDTECVYEDMEREMKAYLMSLADNACVYMHHKRYEHSPWLCNLDWSCKNFRGKAMTKKQMTDLMKRLKKYHQKNEEAFWAMEEEPGFKFLISTEEPCLWPRAVHMPGYPEWYRSLCLRRTADNWRPGCVGISAQTRVTPYLLRMKWKGHPLHHHAKLGWGYIVSPDLSPGETPWFEDDDVNVGVQQLASDSRAELNLEQMMDEYYSLYDNDRPQTGPFLLESSREEEGKGHDSTSQTGHKARGDVGGTRVQTVTTRTHSAKVKPKGKEDGVDLEGAEGEEEGVEEDGVDLVGATSAIKTEQYREKEGAEGKEDGVEEEGAEGEEWKAKNIGTVFGVTDDLVTLGDGKEYYFFKLPHKNGASAHCGNPLSKDFLPKMEDGILTSAAGHMGRRILTLNSMISFWRGARNRILNQFVVSLETDRGSGDTSEWEDEGLGAILPMVKVAGTTTRRAVEPTWLTASNAKETRVGSELKAMVRAPPGYHLVGADVDSQELWIASVLGDMQFAGVHGGTAIGWMTLQGKKTDGTDVHSKTAATIGIHRDHAKILNYGRIYGAGRPFIELLLRTFNPSLTDEEVQEKAGALYTTTKGTKMVQLTEVGQKLAKKYQVATTNDGLVTQEDWKSLRSMVCYLDGRTMETDLVSNRLWVGGSESHMFNKLDSIATSELPRTPVLGCCITKALDPKHVGNDYMTSRVNWVVQSSAVDYLHLMLVSMRWLFDTYGIDGRFCISIHDEVRYLVKSEDRYHAALALQITNLLTRSMFAHHLNMNDLPQSVAFFSAVDIDSVLRKEASMDCKTPSNPLGLSKGHNIPHGEALDIYEILEKTNGSLQR